MNDNWKTKKEQLRQKAKEIKNKKNSSQGQAGGCPIATYGWAARPLGQPHSGWGPKMKKNIHWKEKFIK